MKNTFDFSRFAMLLRRDLCAAWLTYRITLLVIVLLPLMVNMLGYMMGSSVVIDAWVRVYATMACMVLAMCMAPSRIYKDCDVPNKGLHFAMLPVSKRERFWSMMLVCEVVVPLVVLVASVAIDLIISLIPGGPYAEFFWDYSFRRLVFDITGEEVLLARIAVLESVVGIVAVFFFTNTVFRKHKISMTLLWWMLIGWIGMILLEVVVPLLLTWTVDSTLSTVVAWYDIVGVIWIVGFYWGAYYRLKNMKY